MTDNKKALTYKDAGVNINAGNALIERIKSYTGKIRRPGLLSGIGGFGTAFEVPEGYKKPVLISSTDGVGSKLKLASTFQLHETIGIDLVAMCVNDIIVSGAEPLFFLDYYATGQLNIDIADIVIRGIDRGCEMAGCNLTGGETAEMPGMYHKNDYDLAGFCVGIVEKESIITGSQVVPGDKIIALQSSGPHSNGYSLIRKILESVTDYNEVLIDNVPLSKLLMAPTRIYVKSILELLKTCPIKAISHITGGGFQENIPRTLPSDVSAVIDLKSWQQPKVFSWLQSQGNIDSTEMLRTFNCGVGMVITIADEHVNDALMTLTNLGETPWVIGEIKEKSDQSQSVVFAG